MIRPLTLPGVSVREQTPAKRVDAIQRSALNVKPEYCDPEFVGPHASCRTYSVASEKPSATAVGYSNRRRAFNELESEVASPVLDPTEMASPVQIADLARFAGCDDGVSGTEVTHPLPAKLDGFVVGRSSWSGFRRLSHTSRVHPSSVSGSTRSHSSARAGLVGGES